MSNIDVWKSYVDQYKAEPTDSKQLLNFSKNLGLAKPLTYQEASKIFDSHKDKKASNTTKQEVKSTQQQSKPSNNKQEKEEKEDNNNPLFSQLNQGLDITSGLKKVTSDMKTKNQADRSGKVPDTSYESSKKKTEEIKKEENKKAKEKSIKKQGPRLLVENCTEGVEELKECDTKSEINLFQCSNTGFLIPNKVKNIVIDSCKRIQVEVSEVISSIELINCQTVTLYVKKSAPSITIDKSSQPKLYIFDEALSHDPNIITSMVTDMNVCVQNGDDWNEVPVPYQFITKIDKSSKKMSTLPVEHNA